MAYKGINTLTLELKQQLEAVITHYINEGVHMSSIYLTLNNIQQETELKLSKVLKDERDQYNATLQAETNIES